MGTNAFSATTRGLIRECARELVPSPSAPPLGFARGFGKTGQALRDSVPCFGAYPGLTSPSAGAGQAQGCRMPPPSTPLRAGSPGLGSGDSFCVFSQDSGLPCDFFESRVANFKDKVKSGRTRAAAAPQATATSNARSKATDRSVRPTRVASGVEAHDLIGVWRHD
jgi:hypothetical protein